VTLVPAAIGFAVVSSLLLLWMLAAARRAWRALPPGAQVPVRRGLGGWNQWRPKESALRLWPAAGVVIWLANVAIVVSVVTGGASARSTGDTAALPGVLLLPMIVLLVGEQQALKAARAGAARPAPGLGGPQG
jgi:hypothetical protein